MKRAATLALVLVALALAACGGDNDKKSASTPATTATSPAPTATTETTDLARNPGGPKVETIAEGLEIPWEIGFLPDGRALITERPGRVRLLLPDGKLSGKAVANVDVVADGEGGLLGLAVDPDFESNSFVYLYRTTERGNEVARYRLDGTRLREQATIVQDIPGGRDPRRRTDPLRARQASSTSRPARRATASWRRTPTRWAASSSP